MGLQGSPVPVSILRVDCCLIRLITTIYLLRYFSGTAITLKPHDKFVRHMLQSSCFCASSQFCKNIGPTISATITFRNMLEEVVVEVMDGMEKFFKITSYISINSTFDNDDDDDILKHGEGGSGGGGGGGDAEVSANLLEN